MESKSVFFVARVFSTRWAPSRSLFQWSYITYNFPYTWPKIFMGFSGVFTPRDKWSYGSLLITGDGDHLVGE